VSDRVFVYGTLQPGESRWDLLAPYADPDVPPYPAKAPGSLYDTHRGWPAAVFGDGSGRVVAGVVVTLAAGVEDAALGELDRVEGVPHGLFERRRVEVEGQACWTWHWLAATTGFTPIDAWPVPAGGSSTEG